MDADRWQSIQAAFDELVELDEAERARRLAKLGEMDTELRYAVEALLAADAEANTRLASLDEVLLPELGPVLDEAVLRSLDRTIKRVTAGEFEIESVIARGGMGIVYLATETELARKVALKVLPPALTHRDGAAERFQREARTAAALDHPNIIPIYRVGSSGGLMWFSMKLLEGRSLAVILDEENTLSLDRTLEILQPVADALDFAHARGIIHRDIKPGNIMICDDGRVMVTDFGIAKELQASSLTGPGTVLGTPHYMSPEQYIGVEITGAADQYSLAVVAYQMLAGRVPFEATSPYGLLTKHTSTPPPKLQELRPDLPPHVYSAVDRALAKEPAQRFASVREFVASIAGPAPATTHSAPMKRSGRAVTVAGTVGVIGMLGIGAMIVAQRDREKQAGPAVSEIDSTFTALATVTDDATESQTSRPDVAAAEPERRSFDVVTTPPASFSQGPGQPQIPATPEFGLLILNLSAWANIYLDGSPRRTARVHRDSLSPGTHLIRLERAGYVTMDTSVVIVAGDTIVFSIAMRKRD